LAKLFFDEYKRTGDVEKVVDSIFNKLDGAYSVLALQIMKNLLLLEMSMVLGL